MTSPLYKVDIYVNVRCPPKHMNNNINENIRQSVEDKYNKRNFKNYGCIDGIHSIDFIDDNDTSIKNTYRGDVRAEDPTSSALFTVKVNCTMAVPIPGNIIFGTVSMVNEEIIIVDNGRIRMIITKERINKNNIRFDGSSYKQYDQNGVMTGIVERGTRVYVRILGARIIHGKDGISCIGILDSIVPIREVEELDLLEPIVIDSVLDIDEIKEEKKQELIARLNRTNAVPSKRAISMKMYDYDNDYDNDNNNNDSDSIIDDNDKDSVFDSEDFDVSDTE